ncbi:MAG: hypothetical protein HY608_03100 [Planctomycetes bacterium]|nr:hypothetical protein [Planctomycetota bacterium]
MRQHPPRPSPRGSRARPFPAALCLLALALPARAEVPLNEELRVIVGVVQRWGWADLANTRLEAISARSGLTGEQKNILTLARVRVLVARAGGRGAAGPDAPSARQAEELWGGIRAPEDAPSLLSYLEVKLDLARMREKLGEGGRDVAVRSALVAIGECYEAAIPLSMRTDDLSVERQGDLYRLINDILYEKGSMAVRFLREVGGAGAEGIARTAEEDWLNFLWPIEDAWQRGERSTDVALEFAHGLYGLAQLYELTSKSAEASAKYAEAVEKVATVREVRAAFLLSEICPAWCRVLLAQNQNPEGAVRALRASVERGGFDRVNAARLEISLGDLYLRCFNAPSQASARNAWKEKIDAVARALDQKAASDRALQGLVTEARRRWAPALGEAPATTGGNTALLEMGTRLAGEKQWARARACFRAGGARPPRGEPRSDAAAVDAWYAVGSTYAQEKRFLEAAHAFGAAFASCGGDPDRASSIAYYRVYCLEKAEEQELRNAFRDARGGSVAMDWDPLLDAIVAFVDQGYLERYLRTLDPAKDEGRIRAVKNLVYRAGVGYARPARRDFSRSARYFARVEPSHPSYADALRLMARAWYLRATEGGAELSVEERSDAHASAIEANRAFRDALLAQTAPADLPRHRELLAEATYHLARLYINGYEGPSGRTGEEPRKGIEVLSGWEEALGSESPEYPAVLTHRCAAFAAHGVREMEGAERALESLKHLAASRPDRRELVKKAGQRLTQDYRLYLQELGEGAPQEVRDRLGTRIRVLVTEYGGEGVEVQVRAVAELFGGRNYAEFHSAAGAFLGSYASDVDKRAENFSFIAAIFQMSRDAHRSQEMWAEAYEDCRLRNELYAQVQNRIPWNFKLQEADAAWEAVQHLPAGDARVAGFLDVAERLYGDVAGSFARQGDAEQRLLSWAPSARWVEVRWLRGRGDAAREKELAQALFSLYHRSPPGKPFGGEPHQSVVTEVVRALAEGAVDPAAGEMARAILAECERGEAPEEGRAE